MPGVNYSGWGWDAPFSASGDLGAAQYRFVQPAQTYRLVERSTGGSAPAPLGILQNDPNTGEEAAVRVLGTSYLYVSTACGNIGYRDFLTAGSDGQGVLAGGAGAGSALHAMALPPSTITAGSGILIEALLLLNPMSGSAGFVDNTP
jgi:hypothetical protein